MPKRSIESEIERKIWRALARERVSRGISQAYASEALGLSRASISQLENNAIGSCFQRIRDYSVKVLRCQVVIALPGGIRLKSLEGTTELAGVNFNEESRNNGG